MPATLGTTETSSIQNLSGRSKENSQCEQFPKSIKIESIRSDVCGLATKKDKSSDDSSHSSQAKESSANFKFVIINKQIVTRKKEYKSTSCFMQFSTKKIIGLTSLVLDFAITAKTTPNDFKHAVYRKYWFFNILIRNQGTTSTTIALIKVAEKTSRVSCSSKRHHGATQCIQWFSAQTLGKEIGLAPFSTWSHIIWCCCTGSQFVAFQSMEQIGHRTFLIKVSHFGTKFWRSILVQNHCFHCIFDEFLQQWEQQKAQQCS